MRSQEDRLFNNLQMTVSRVDNLSQELTTSFRDSKDQNCSHYLPLTEIFQDGEILSIDGCVFIVCSEIDDDSRSSFYIALNRDVDVHSQAPSQYPTLH